MYNKLIRYIKNKVKLITDGSYREQKRLLKLSRFTPTTSFLLNKKIYIVDSISYLVGIEEIFHKKNYQFNSSTKTPLILDCGANIGLATIFFKMHYPKSRVIAFEPDEVIFKALKKNILSFGLQDVVLYQKAVWNEQTTLDFKKEGGFSGRLVKPGDASKLAKVNTVRLKDFLNEKVDFLKIDIEGAETHVIKDCADKLGNVEKIFIEYHSHFREKQTLQEILSILVDNDFRYHIKEVYVASQPFIERPLMEGMEFQIDIFAFK